MWVHYVRVVVVFFFFFFSVFFFQAEDGIRDLVRSRGLGDVYKRQGHAHLPPDGRLGWTGRRSRRGLRDGPARGRDQARLRGHGLQACLLYTSDAADERSSVDLGGRRIIKKKNQKKQRRARFLEDTERQA